MMVNPVHLLVQLKQLRVYSQLHELISRYDVNATSG